MYNCLGFRMRSRSVVRGGGATLVQLREKQMSAKEFYEQAKAAVALLSNAECG